MEFLRTLFIENPALKAIVVLSFISAIGIMLGKIRVFGISLGITFVFFIGIIAGHFNIDIDERMLSYAQTFGLVLFVYALGLQVGPGFFSSMRTEGVKLITPALVLLAFGTILAIGLGYCFKISMPDTSGILCGATTNTPALAAAQQTLEQTLGQKGVEDVSEAVSGAALGCAITYPMGVVGVILAIVFLRKFFVRAKDLPQPDSKHKKNVFIASYRVTNPDIFGKTIEEVARNSKNHFVISRMWHNGHVIIPMSERKLLENDIVLVLTKPDETEDLGHIFGEQEKKDWNNGKIDWNKIDSELISQRIIVTRPEINGKKLSSLRLRNNYGINISRVYRSGVQLLATPDLILQMGDRLTVVGEADDIKRVEKILGNAVKSLNEPNLVSVFIGMMLGLLVGSIPLSIPGLSMSVKLGLAGGPIIVGILIGTFGPRLHMITYTTQSANMMLRSLGLNLYLACLGLDAGEHFFETVFRPEGLLWLLVGVVITFVPVVIVGILTMRWMKLDFGSTTGLLCGSMANPMALDYANTTIEGDNPSVAYATVYPVCMFLRVIIIQILIMLLV